MGFWIDVDSLHYQSTYEDMFMDPQLSLPEINNTLLGLANIESKIVVLTLLN